MPLMTMRALFLSALFLLPFAAPSAQDYFPPSDAKGGWREAKDAAAARKVAAVDVRRLEQAFDYARRSSQHGGLLVVRHGYLVYERYYGKGNRNANPTMASVGKAFVSVAAGIMLDERKADFPEGLDQKVFTQKYLPQALPLDDAAKAEINLGQLLSMAAGFRGEGSNPGFVNNVPSPLPALAKPVQPGLDQDMTALRTPLWTVPGGGYSYASSSPHVASMVVRNITGKEVRDYLDEKLGQPLGFGQWGWQNRAGQNALPHNPGGGGVAVHATDALRFGYLLLHKGAWAGKQILSSGYVDKLSHPSPYQKHAPYSLSFENNADGHVAGAPKDAYFKSGGGGFGIYVIPSLDMVIYKMAGNDTQYDPAATGLKQDYPYDGSRDQWKAEPHTQFSDGPIGVDDGVRRVLEMVIAALIP
jgi:CubicO group peptidase (beta-lactamase class C family)